MSRGINIFISHCGDDEEYMEKLKSLISSRYSFIRDSSLKESEANTATNVDYIKTLIRPLIDWAGTVIVLIGKRTSQRDWVNWEIEYAMKKGKNIVGVYIPGSTDADAPEGLNEYSSSIIGWNSKSIFDAIEGKACFEHADGSIRPYDGTGRATC